MEWQLLLRLVSVVNDLVRQHYSLVINQLRSVIVFRIIREFRNNYAQYNPIEKP